MNRRQLLSLSMLAALPLAESPPPKETVRAAYGAARAELAIKPVLVGSDGFILNLGSFPKEGLADLQRHLHWLHTDPDYFLRIDFPIDYADERPEEWERIIPVDHEHNHKVPVVSNYRVVDAGTARGLLLPGMQETFLSQENVVALQEVLELAKADPDYQLFANYPIRCTDPALQARVHIFDEASDEEIEAQRTAWDNWAYGVTESRA